MPSWLKSATYLASTACGLVATLQPQYATFLVPLATFLAGYATTHPADTAAAAKAAAPTPSAQAVAQLAAQLQAQVAALKAK